MEVDLSKLHAMLNDDSGYLAEKAIRDAREQERLRNTVVGKLLEYIIKVDKSAMDLVHAQGRMLEKWSEVSEEKKQELWKDLHQKGEALRQLLEK